MNRQNLLQAFFSRSLIALPLVGNYNTNTLCLIKSLTTLDHAGLQWDVELRPIQHRKALGVEVVGDPVIWRTFTFTE